MLVSFLTGFLFGVLFIGASFYFGIGAFCFFLFGLFFNKKKMVSFILAFLLSISLMLFIRRGGSEKQFETLGIVFKTSENYFLLWTPKGSFYCDVKERIPLFSLLKVSGGTKFLSFATYEGNFDFKSYLNHRNVFYEFKIQSSSFLFKPYPLIGMYQTWVLKYYSGESKYLASQFLFSSGMANLASFDSLRESGLIRMISGTGLHISFLLKVLQDHVFKKEKSKYKSVLTLFIPIFFWIISAFKFGLFRLVVKRVLLTRKEKVPFKSNFEVDCLTALILLFMWPNMVFDSAFYFPFLILFFNHVTKLYFQNLPKVKRLLLRPVFLFLLFLPLYLVTTGTIPFLSLFMNGIFLLPSCLLFLLSLCTLFFPLFALALSPLLNLYIGFLGKFTSIGNLSYGSFSFLFLIPYYFVLFLFFILHEYGIKRASISLTLLPTLLFLQPMDIFLPKSEVFFINVGQGDAALIRNKKLNILIDTGGLKQIDLAKECLIPFFKMERISKLDAVLITHEDFDHSGALENLKKSFPIEKVLFGPSLARNSFYIGDMFFEDLNEHSSSKSSNDNSGVFYFQIKEKSFLMMGDVSSTIEKEILRRKPSLKADVLKIGHHGSKYSSSLEFLKAVSPEMAVLSVGANNYYGHPSKEVLDRLDYLSIPYVRTDQVGTYRYKV